MNNREFLMLAKDYSEKADLTAYMWSEKLDGQRAFWDGGISRGVPAATIGYCNTLKDKKEYPATGLYTRYGKVIFAPDDWLDQLPLWPLDGELYTKRNDRDNLRSIISRKTPDSRWESVRYRVFDSPPLANIFKDGKINNPHWSAVFDGILVAGNTLESTTHFIDAYNFLKTLNVDLVEQHEVDQSMMAGILKGLSDQGAEGVMYRYKYSLWQPTRNTNLLKHKLFDDAEGTVIGYTWAKDGKFKGMMGSILVRDDSGHTFGVGGFRDSERILITALGGSAFGFWDPGKDIQNGIYNTKFPIGSQLRYKHWGFTSDGIPQSAQYWR